MMHMTFYWGKDVTILFDFWRVQTWTWYAVSLVVVFIFSVLHEWLASQRSALSAKVEKGKDPAVSAAEEDGDHQTPFISHAYAGQKSVSKKAMEAVLFGIIVGLGYMLMLAAMSFNGGVFVAIVAGLAFGHFVYRSEGSPSDSACGAM